MVLKICLNCPFKTKACMKTSWQPVALVQSENWCFFFCNHIIFLEACVCVHNFVTFFIFIQVCQYWVWFCWIWPGVAIDNHHHIYWTRSSCPHHYFGGNRGLRQEKKERKKQQSTCGCYGRCSKLNNQQYSVWSVRLYHIHIYNFRLNLKFGS